MTFSSIHKLVILTLFGILGLNLFSSWNPTFAQDEGEAENPRAPLIPIETFAALANATSVEISPTGKWLSMIREVDNVPHILIQELRNKDNWQLIPPYKNLNINWYQWVNKDYIIISFEFDSFSYSLPVTRTILTSFNVVTKELKNIIKPRKFAGDTLRAREDKKPQFQDNVVDILKNDPFHILMAIDDTYGSDKGLRKVDIRTGGYKITQPELNGIRNWYQDHKGKLRFATGTYGNKKKNIYFSENSKSYIDYKKTPAFEQKMTPAAYTDDFDVVIMRQAFEKKTSRYLTFNMKTNKIEKILFEDDEISPSYLMKEPTFGNTPVIGIRFIKDMPETLVFDETWAKLYRSINKALPDTFNYIVSSSQDKNILIIKASSDQNPGIYYAWDRPNKIFTEIISANPNIDPIQMATKKRIDYKARDGLNIPAYLSIPIGVNPRNLPLVVVPHKGAYSRTIKTFGYTTQFLVNRGYAVLQPNYRGSSGYRKDFLDASDQRWGLEPQDDITDGVKYLIDKGIVNPKRICIIGEGFGGYSALMGAVKTPNLYKCAASINGVSNLNRLMGFKGNFIGGKIGNSYIANSSTPKKQLQETSPALQANNIKIPILLIHFKDNRTYPINQTEMMVSSLKKAKKEFTYKEFKHGGHSMLNQQARIEVLTELEKFLAKHLK